MFGGGVGGLRWLVSVVGGCVFGGRWMVVVVCFWWSCQWLGVVCLVVVSMVCGLWWLVVVSVVSGVSGWWIAVGGVKS